MQHEVEINGRIRQVVVNRQGDEFAVAVDGRTWQVNAAHVDAHTLSLLIGDDEVRLKPDTTTEKNPDEKNADEKNADVVSAFRRTVAGGTTETRSSYEVTIALDRASAQLVVHVAGPARSLGRRTTLVLVASNGRRRRARKEDGAHAGSGPQRIVAPMPGKIVRVLVKSGEAVHARQPLVVVEAMKMENELRAGRDGTVAEIHAQEGMSVDAGVLLVVIQ